MMMLSGWAYAQSQASSNEYASRASCDSWISEASLDQWSSHWIIF